MIDRSTLSWAAVSSGTGGGAPCGVRPRGLGPTSEDRWLPGLGAGPTTRGAGRTDAQRRIGGAALAVPRRGSGRPAVSPPAVLSPRCRLGRGVPGAADDAPSRGANGVLSTCHVGAAPPDGRAPPRDGTTERPGRNALRLVLACPPRPGPTAAPPVRIAVPAAFVVPALRTLPVPPVLRERRPVAPAARVSVPTDAPASALVDRTGVGADPAHRRKVVRAMGRRTPSRWAAPGADGAAPAVAPTAARAWVPCALAA